MKDLHSVYVLNLTPQNKVEARWVSEWPSGHTQTKKVGMSSQKLVLLMSLKEAAAP